MYGLSPQMNNRNGPDNWHAPQEDEGAASRFLHDLSAQF